MRAATPEVDGILAGLNPMQRAAVEHTDGPLLILAGAGSGKTSVLTRRIAYLIGTRRAAPWSILAITFTNKAAREMRDRIEGLVGPIAQDIWAMTFHAMCVRILRRDIQRLGYQSGFTILDDGDQLATVKRILADLNIDSKRYEPRAVLSAISNAKNVLRTAAQVRDRAGNPFERVVGDVYLEYERRLKANNALDFDDLILKTVQLFEQAPDVLEFYHRRFHYIHVDEYQDTNHAQYRLVRLLADKRRNLCVVGDSDQSIYGWRGADIQNILQFERDYPDATVIRLEQNYRSTKTILAIANEVIRHNVERKEKTLWTDNPEGEPATLYRAVDERAEAAYIVGKMEQYRRQGRDWSEMAVLYRVNAQSRVIEEAMLQQGIPYRIFGGVKFYDRKEIRDVLAYLRLIHNPADDISLQRIVNVPKRGIGDGTMDKLQHWSVVHGVPLLEACRRAGEAGVSGKALKALGEFVETLDHLRQMRPFLSVTELTEQVLERTAYRRALAAEKTLEAEARVENLDEFLSVTREFDQRWEAAGGGIAVRGGGAGLSGTAPAAGIHVEDGADSDAVDDADIGEMEDTVLYGGPLAEFLAEVALLADTDLNQGKPDPGAPEENKVSLMTLHAAKGLEFPIVFMPGLEEGLFPHSRAIDSEREMEEERRLCYVGVTRAREKLYLTTCTTRTIFGQYRACMPSRFLGEMPPQHVQLDDPGRRPRAPWSPRPGSSGRDAADGQSTGVRDAGAKGSGAVGVPAAGDPFTPDRVAQYRAGDKVEHRKWGRGTVVEVHGAGDDQELTIAFPAPTGIKRLAARFAPIRKAD
ncbi:MAG: UvrD-helicase domain-containing protein [Alicyclobacillus macrosporangiidus]|uniref:UvrD-helicase domain-containing protein n=1 Tax=Alicyclobacillus macrosporangiidus TaxID=392015 RepID=UPI0026EAEB75|nr:UvrD-helicase domain-containing protein [Alicyclobacillus macrosporangiidus]MCL6600034.1 UvrD-helicase domain-containing protein [Alicyclobacillus macrosporangiidus]